MFNLTTRKRRTAVVNASRPRDLCYCKQERTDIASGGSGRRIVPLFEHLFVGKGCSLEVTVQRLIVRYASRELAQIDSSFMQGRFSLSAFITSVCLLMQFWSNCLQGTAWYHRARSEGSKARRVSQESAHNSQISLMSKAVLISGDCRRSKAGPAQAEHCWHLRDPVPQSTL